jgi:hypothetical protein
MSVHDIRKPAPLAAEFQPKFDSTGLDAMIERLSQKTAEALKERAARALAADEALKVALFDPD